jgi:hypothetical protein
LLHDGWVTLCVNNVNTYFLLPVDLAFKADKKIRRMKHSARPLQPPKFAGAIPQTGVMNHNPCLTYGRSHCHYFYRRNTANTSA